MTTITAANFDRIHDTLGGDREAATKVVVSLHRNGLERTASAFNLMCPSKLQKAALMLHEQSGVNVPDIHSKSLSSQGLMWSIDRIDSFDDAYTYVDRKTGSGSVHGISFNLQAHDIAKATAHHLHFRTGGYAGYDTKEELEQSISNDYSLRLCVGRAVQNAMIRHIKESLLRNEDLPQSIKRHATRLACRMAHLDRVTSALVIIAKVVPCTDNVWKVCADAKVRGSVNVGQPGMNKQAHSFVALGSAASKVLTDPQHLNAEEKDAYDATSSALEVVEAFLKGDGDSTPEGNVELLAGVTKVKNRIVEAVSPAIINQNLMQHEQGTHRYYEDAMQDGDSLVDAVEIDDDGMSDVGNISEAHVYRTAALCSSHCDMDPATIPAIVAIGRSKVALCVIENIEKAAFGALNAAYGEDLKTTSDSLRRSRVSAAIMVASTDIKNLANSRSLSAVANAEQGITRIISSTLEERLSH